MKKIKLVIVGLGISGISLAKEAIKNNINYLVLEKEENLGGIWNFASEFSCLQTHKDYYGFNDIKIPKNYSDYPNKKELLIYLNKICKKYNIFDNTIFNYKVKNIYYDYKEKLWIINEEFKSEYLGICSGYLSKPRKELINNELKHFEGTIIHSKDFNTIKNYQMINKNILIFGNGASACDILKNIDKQKIKCNTTIVYTKNKYFLEKYISSIPISKFLNKFLLNYGKYCPLFLYRFIFLCLNLLYFKNYLDLPYEKMNSTNLIASNIISEKIKDNSLVYIKDVVKDSHKNNVILENNILVNVDIIILATGYEEQFDFFKNQPSKKKYLQIFDKNFKNCAFIGFSPSYNWSKVAEKQSKIFIDFIKGRFTFNDLQYNEYLKCHNIKQKYNNLLFNDLTYELYNY